MKYILEGTGRWEISPPQWNSANCCSMLLVRVYNINKRQDPPLPPPLAGHTYMILGVWLVFTGKKVILATPCFSDLNPN